MDLSGQRRSQFTLAETSLGCVRRRIGNHRNSSPYMVNPSEAAVNASHREQELRRSFFHKSQRPNDLTISHH